jgi:hypothetical protein
MTYFFDEDMRSGLKRLAFGLQVRIVLVAIGIPLWVWMMQTRHPQQAWVEGAFWLVCPLTDLMMAWGAHRMGSRAGATALLLAGLANLYAGLIGFSGSALGRGQIPFAMGFAELVALIGVFSTLAFLRGPVEDSGHGGLSSRIYKAMAHVFISLACILIVRSVMWQGYFAGLAATIVASVVVVLVIIALLEVVSVLGVSADAEGVLPADVVDAAPDAPVRLARRAVPGYHARGFKGAPRDDQELEHD